MQRSSYIFSASLHAGILAWAIFGLPHLFDVPKDAEPPVILAEFVPIADKTNVPKPQPKLAEKKAEPKEEPAPQAKPEPPPPKPPPAATAPPAPPPPPEPPKQAEAPKPAPEPPPPPPKQAEVVKAPEPPKKVEAPKPAPKPQPPRREEVQRPPEKSKQPSFADVAALVNKMKAPPAPQPNQAPQTASRTPPAAAPRAVGPSNPNLPISMSEKDFIRKQIEDQWLFDLGAKDAQNLIVQIRFSLNADGTLKQQPEIVDKLRMYAPGQESYRAAAESARRAVLKAAPFRLPPGDKDRWSQEIILTFDPRQMLGG